MNRPRNERQQLDHDLIRKPWAEGLSVQDICDRLGYKILSVRTTVANLGLSVKGQPRRSRVEPAD